MEGNEGGWFYYFIGDSSGTNERLLCLPFSFVTDGVNVNDH